MNVENGSDKSVHVHVTEHGHFKHKHMADGYIIKWLSVRLLRMNKSQIFCGYSLPTQPTRHSSLLFGANWLYRLMVK